MLASGILGISVDVFRRVLGAGAGAVVTKSLSREPWEGYSNPTITGTGGGGWLNAVGLSNPGASAFAGMLKGQGLPAVVSLVGSAPAEFVSMIKEFRDGAAAFEINLSCPHVAKVGLEVGDDPGLVGEIVSAAKRAADVPVFAKVGLGSTHYIKTAGAAAEAGADAITAINTVRAMSIDVEAKKPVLSNGFGGLSGPPIRPIAVRCVWELASKYDVPVIGCGGVSSWEDAIEMMLAGACAVQVGSAAGGRIGIFGEINAGILGYMERNGFGSVKEMVGLART
ncbi:dihydroorotate dehydrogenase [Cenarchaeum symbiosum A]|uniref:Dihydroorotate dehydrogenase n=1 Tax=Cenarchaeum symbiosum (strain A) TaxID=414004 RepID=A0RV22_CENSY|nr:dihydroorotate dehydrogenase [Cenarchaeum symbiosum A]